MHHPLLVGCPLRGREWMTESWVESIMRETASLGVKEAYVFIGDLKDPAVQGFANLCMEHDRQVYLVHEDEPTYEDRRVWNAGRYERMIHLRNRLLGRVRDIAPSYFLSMDSDMLFANGALSSMFNVLTDYDAVGGKAYMETPPASNSRLTNRSNPSYYIFRRDRPKRQDSSNVMEVDVIMGIKLMSPKAYHIDYEFHDYGEDVGWSIACKRAGLRLGWDGSKVNKHVMKEQYLTKVDPRCGF